MTPTLHNPFPLLTFFQNMSRLSSEGLFCLMVYTLSVWEAWRACPFFKPDPAPDSARSRSRCSCPAGRINSVLEAILRCPCPPSTKYPWEKVRWWPPLPGSPPPSVIAAVAAADIAPPYPPPVSQTSDKEVKGRSSSSIKVSNYKPTLMPRVNE